MKWADKRYVYYVPKYMYVTVLTLDLEQKYAKHTCIYIYRPSWKKIAISNNYLSK